MEMVVAKAAESNLRCVAEESRNAFIMSNNFAQNESAPLLKLNTHIIIIVSFAGFHSFELVLSTQVFGEFPKAV
jgi:hypothetical protein